MKNLDRSLRGLNGILNVFFWLLVVRGVFSVGYHIRELYTLFTDTATLSDEMALVFDSLTLHADKGFGVVLDAIATMRLVYLISAIVITVVACAGVRCLKQILLPIELGQPFSRGISVQIRKLGMCAFWLSIAENLSDLATLIVIENHYGIGELLTGPIITRVSITPELKPAWFIVTAVLSILGMVFRRGEVLQTLADETL